jgi:thiol:disulfide interchange protein
MSDKYVFAHLDVDKQSEAAAKYNVASVPSLMVLDADGNVKQKIRATFDVDELVSQLKQIAE